ncbi:MAG: hypothetical protein ACJ8AO_15850 [Gemmatimonadaceae bacterium]|jgi:hypothetical protein
MPRRIVLLALALTSLVLGACAAPTAPRADTTDSACSIITNGSHTRGC